MKTHDFYYDLPQELIAQTPLADRDSSRLLVLHKDTGGLEHRTFHDVIDYLQPGDCLVLNNSRVLPARLLGHREPTGGAVEVLLLKDLGSDTWECLTKPGRKTPVGTTLSFGDGLLTATVVEAMEDGNKKVCFHYAGIFLELLERLGKMPLPPYIKEELQDQERYQTVYSKVNGSAAAPTAGLHFTPELLRAIRDKGVELAYVTLHVGLGTFRPVKAEEITDHHMHAEFCMLDAPTAKLPINIPALDDSYSFSDTLLYERGFGLTYGGLLGDADLSGEVDITDATLIRRYDARLIKLSEIAPAHADVDGDGEISIIDATWLQRWDLGLKAPEAIGKPI